MKKRELKNFYNQGFGWVCTKCEANSTNETTEKSRLMTEGEAESKTPVYSNKAMAKWKDENQNALICPICETIEKV